MAGKKKSGLKEAAEYIWKPFKLIKTVDKKIKKKVEDKATKAAKKKAADFLANPPDTVKYLTPEQEGIMSLLSKLGMTHANDLYPRMFGDEKGVMPEGAGFQPIQQAAQQGFQESSVPTISDRYTSMSRNPQFSNIVSSGGEGLEKDLGALGSQYDMNQLGQQQNFLSMLLSGGMQRQFDPIVQGLPDNPYYQFAGQLGGNVLKGLPGMDFGSKAKG